MPETISTSTQNLSRITEELYKQNIELTERNKTLSITERIDDIILSNVTDIQQIASQIVTIIINQAEGKIAALFTLQDTTLKRIAFGTSPHFENAAETIEPLFFNENISISDTSFIATAVREKRTISLDDFCQLFPALPEETVNKIVEAGTITQTAIYPLIVKDEPIGALLIARSDIESSLKEYYEDLVGRVVTHVGIALNNTLLYKHIQEANLQLQNMDHTKDEFVSLVSHELRTPMTTIKGFISVILDETKDTLSEDHRKLLTMAYNSTDRLIKLVNDMLDVSRIESGRVKITLQPVNITDIATATLNELAGEASKHGLTLIIDQASNAAHMVYADSDKTKEVIFNLVNNAIKFTPAGGKVTIHFKEDDGIVTTDVIDTGRGITPDDLSKLFAKFSRLQEADGQKIEGTGLGLYISKAIIEAQKGKIWVTSQGRDTGATFSFSLPKAQ